MPVVFFCVCLLANSRPEALQVITKRGIANEQGLTVLHRHLSSSLDLVLDAYVIPGAGNVLGIQKWPHHGPGPQGNLTQL